LIGRGTKKNITQRKNFEKILNAVNYIKDGLKTEEIMKVIQSDE
jgi:uncharacterized protein YeeX (DUF496 family)